MESLVLFVKSQGPFVGTFIFGFLSGLIPVLNIEVYLVGVVALLGVTDLLWLIALLAAAGQILAKIVLYQASAGVITFGKRRQVNAERARKLTASLMQGGWRGDSIMFSSALVGLPPIYLTSLVAGVAHYPLVRFFLIGLTGRFLRCLIFVSFPGLFTSIRNLF